MARAAAQVLILHSYHYGYTWTDSINEGIFSTFGKKAPLDNLIVEYMNSKRHDPKQISPHLYNLYKEIYKNASLDLIIATDNNALDFLQHYRDDLFPGVPVVFCGINDIEMAQLRQSKNITGVGEKIDIKSTLNIIKKLHPNVTSIAAIADNTETGQININLFLQAIKQVDGLTPIVLTDLTADELRSRLGKLNPNTAILNLSFFRDAAGRSFSVEQANNLLNQSTNLPRYTAWDFMLGPGVIGGTLVSGKLQGEAAANLAIMILNGERPDRIPFQESPNANIFDHNELNRHNIDPSNLPPGHILLNASPPLIFLDRSTTLVILIVVVFTVSFFLLVAHNIKVRRNAAQAMTSTEERFKQLADAAWEAIIIQDEGRIHQVNDQFYAMFGYRKQDTAMVDSVELLVSPESRREFRQHLAKKSTQPFDLKAIRQNGTTFPVEMRIKRMNFHGIEADVLVIRDITERKLVEIKLAEINKTLENLVNERTKTLDQKAHELEVANFKLLELDELKSTFMTTVSHDIRTPLTSILGFTKLISKEFKSSFLSITENDPKLAKKGNRIVSNLAIIEEEGERLKRLINDFLDLTRIESGSAEWHDQEINVKHLILQAKAVVSGLSDKGVSAQIYTHIDESLPILRADPDRIMQVLTNLLGNAAKFSPPDKPIHIAVNSKNGAVEISVSDEGPGIPEKDLVSIFDKFYQVGSKVTTPEIQKGTGLGLAICKQIIEHYKGHIRAESILGKGSTFTFSLPI